jgi:predicted NAD/FAD-binding protein
MMQVAVIGSGISGLATAWLLSRQHRVTLFEAEQRLGGHTHTVDLTLDGQTFAVDTGFLVFNHRTYPQLTQLFRQLGVETVASEMSFSFRMDDPQLEWAGSSLDTLFGQRANLLRPQFWWMLREMLRFNRSAVRDLPMHGDLTLGDYLRLRGYGRPFIDWYLLPMAAAIWSAPTARILEFSLSSFVAFCNNHGLLQIFDRPRWYTVKGGGREYVQRLAAGIDQIRLGQPVESLRRRDGCIELSSGAFQGRYDQVVLACHSDQSALLLARDFPQQVQWLRRIPYQHNHVVLHSDPQVLPRRRKLWSAWNYQAVSSAEGTAQSGAGRAVAVHYLINRLQPLPTATPVIVSLNPVEPIDPALVHRRFDYSHPLFSFDSTRVQQQITARNGEQGIWLAGAWLGHGFHEDGLASALRVARALDVVSPWEGLADAA